LPFTPFHFGPALFLGVIFGYLFLPVFLVSSVIADLEPLAVIVTGIDYPLHGFFHSFIGGSIAASLVYLASKKVWKKVDGKRLLAASFAGVYLHILLDAPLYSDIKPFFPIEANPFYAPEFSGATYAGCAALFLIGALLFAYRLATGSVKISSFLP